MLVILSLRKESTLQTPYCMGVAVWWCNSAPSIASDKRLTCVGFRRRSCPTGGLFAERTSLVRPQSRYTIPKRDPPRPEWDSSGRPEYFVQRILYAEQRACTE